MLSNLFAPGKIGTLNLKNRLVMAAMGTHSAEIDGTMNQRTIDYYVERARGGVGLIITQGASLAPQLRIPHMFAAHDDQFIPGLKELVNAVHDHDTRICCQILHPGLLVTGGWFGYESPPAGIEDLGPSKVPCFSFKVIPREVSIAEIHEIVEYHAAGAGRIKSAGFDAVEIHAAHGYFLSAFLSPFRNKRTDEYGGSIEKRARLACEVISGVRAKVGKDFPVLIRMNGSDYLEGGLTIEEAKIQAAMFVEAGADAIDVSVSTPDSREWRDLTYMYPDGAIVHLAQAIKQTVKVPVIAVGKIGDPVFADRLLEEKKADFIAMGRPLLADPYLPDKAKHGNYDDIRYCVFCNNCRNNYGLRERIKSRGGGIVCTVNPSLLREREYSLKKVPVSKKVMVIGGGVAGMEAAAVLAERGHRVSLFERDSELGGQWKTASISAEKAIFKKLTENQVRHIKRSGVEIFLNKEVTAQFVKQEKPDAVVIATGATPLLLNVPGKDGANVVQAVDIIKGTARAGNNVLVIGGRLRGMEVADLLAGQGKTVTIVTKKGLGENGAPLERNVFITLRNRLVSKRVMVFAHSLVYEIRDNGALIVSEGELLFLPADTVVMAVGAKPENNLYLELKGVVPELYTVGDCIEARDAREAVNEGGAIGRLI